MIGVAMIGAGRMARVHAKAIRNTRARIASVYDVLPENSASLAEELGAKFCRTAEEAMSAPGVDAVIIASSAASHVEHIKLAVSLGKRVMCEKPLAQSYVGALEIHAHLGAEAKRVFMAFNRRFDPGHRRMWERIRAGEIGNVTQLVMHSRDPGLPPRDYIEKSGGQFRDMMVHNFDMARWLLGEEPVSVYATGSCVHEAWVAEAGDVDHSASILMTASGKIAVLAESRVCSFGFDQRIEAHGSKGMLLSENPTQTPLKFYGLGGTDAHYASSDRLKLFFLERYGESYAQEIEAFVDVVVDDADAPVNVHDGLRSAYISEAATRSFHTGQPVALNERSVFEDPIPKQKSA
ncbi:MAG: Gfo/Idh/MocA family oxidoreductase [Rhodobacterales bacterium]|nr:Gfo/Idh/MocA family oxidoreductase [Rhodobacterales bacterium]